MAVGSSSSSSSRQVLTRAASRTQSFFAPRRSWRELIAHPSSYSPPLSLPDLTSRIPRNLAYFRVNYAIIVLLLLFLSLLYHPVSMIVFLIILVFWITLFFQRDEPLIVFNRMVDDRVVLVVLGVVTVVGLVLCGVWVNVIVAVGVGMGVVLLHAAVRVTEDFYVEIDEDSDGGGGLLSFVATTTTTTSNAPPRF